MIRKIVVLFSVGLLSGCTQVVDGTTSQSPTPSVSHTETCELSPLTNLCYQPTNPVLAVKIDDLDSARPQYALNDADVVIVEPVEAGLTRLMAIYNSELPELVGPVRSARITDLDLATAFGRPAFAYSGSTSKLIPYLSDSALQLVGAPQGGEGYFREEGRTAPHDYIAQTEVLLQRLADSNSAALTSTQNWSFGEYSGIGKTPQAIQVDWASSQKVFSWDQVSQSWLIDSDGETTYSKNADGSLELAKAKTVFIQETQLLDSPFVFSNGTVTPYAQTTGTGKGWLLTRGQVLYVTWLRPLITDLPIWLDKNGTQIPLQSGNLWWLIAPRVDSNVQLIFPAAATAEPSIAAQTP